MAVDQTLEQAYKRSESAVPDSQLSAAELALIRLKEPGGGSPATTMDPRVRTAFKFGALCATSLTAAQTARLLHHRHRWVHAAVRTHRLYSLGFAQDDMRWLPLFQLDDTGSLIPHVADVFPQLDENIHPVGVFNWFTSPNPDLTQSSRGFEPISPRDWLLHQYSPKPVTQLAAGLAVGSPA